MASGAVVATLTVAGQPDQPIGFFSPGGGVVQFETKDLDLGDRRFEKFLDAIKLGFDDEQFLGAVSIQVGRRNHFNEAIMWGPVTAVPNADQPVYDVAGEEVRYFRLRVIDNVPFGKWKLKNIDFYGRKVGGKM